MAIDREGKWRKLAAKRQLISILLLGFMVILLAHLLRPTIGDWSILVTEFGIACVIAAILGHVIDEQLKQGLVEDAVSAAIGYLLPPELKDELRWVYDQKFIVTQTYVVRLERVSQDFGRYHARVIRMIRNISGDRARVHVTGGTDEWFHPSKEPSQIPVATYTQKGQTFALRVRDSEVGVTYASDEEVWLDSQETIQAVFCYVNIVRDAGLEVLTYRYPITNALVTVDVDPNLMAVVTFSHREKFDAPEIGETGFLTRPLNGVLLPHQDIRVQWYPAKEVEERRRRIASA